MKNENGGRIEQDISFWLEKEKKLKELFRSDIVNERHFLNEKLRYFNSVQNKYKHNLHEGDRIILNVLKGDIRMLERQLYPNPVIRLLAKVERAIQEMFEQRSMNQYLKAKHLPLNFNKAKIRNTDLKSSHDNTKQTLRVNTTKEIKQKEQEMQRLDDAPLKNTFSERYTISPAPLRNQNAESIKSESSKLNGETTQKKQLRHRLQ